MKEDGDGLAQLRAAIDAIPEWAWSLPSSYAATKVHHGYRIVRIVVVGKFQRYADAFASVLEQYAPVREAWVSALEPGGFIAPHADGGPWYERWQVPIYTAGWFHQGEHYEPTDGVAFPVRHWEPHYLANPTENRRVNLVIDRDIRIDRKVEPFRFLPVVPEIEELIHAQA